VGSPVFFASNALGFWYVAHYYKPAWLYPAFYIWVGIYGVLAPAQAWTLANHALTTREAKRLFGLVGSGAISGFIFGGFLTRQIVGRFGAARAAAFDLMLRLAGSGGRGQTGSDQERRRVAPAVGAKRGHGGRSPLRNAIAMPRAPASTTWLVKWGG
jgi:hypothetical protein